MIDKPQILDLVESTSSTIAGGASQVFAVPITNYINIQVGIPIGVTELTPVGVSDPNGTTRNEDRLIDGNLTNVVRNQGGADLTNTGVAALDMGAATQVRYIDIYWIDTERLPDTFKLQSSTDDVVWTDETGTLTPAFNLGFPTDAQRISMSDPTARYYRLFIIATTNANSQWRLSEMRTYSPPTSTNELDISSVDGLEVSDDGSGNIEITNTTGESFPITINYL